MLTPDQIGAALMLNTVAALAFELPSTSTLRFCIGNTAIDDGQGGWYRYSASSVAVANGNSVVAANTVVGGNWLKCT